MKTLNEIQDDLATLRAEVLESCDIYPATDYGLDARCGPLYCTEEYLVTENRRLLDYYGGFEYVDPACVIPLGDLTIYTIEDGRVLRAMITLEHNHD